MFYSLNIKMSTILKIRISNGCLLLALYLFASIVHIHANGLVFIKCTLDPNSMSGVPLQDFFVITGDFIIHWNISSVKYSV